MTKNTKKTIRTVLNTDWQEALQDVSKEYAISWIQENVPDGYELTYEYGYECSTYGTLTHERPETDEEYAARLKKEAEQEAAREREKIEDARRLLETAEEKIRVAKATNVALAAYLEKHKGNPNLSVLEHMFLAVSDLEGSGRHICAKEIRDLMVELEI